MKKAIIVCIGDELIIGTSIDTNTPYLRGKLLSIGIPVVSSYTVRDDRGQIARALESACAEADIIVTTGGLGPTDDDLTREALSKFLGRELRLDKQLLQRIGQYFKLQDRRMADRNRSQACVPAGSKPITNNLGTAPGFIARKEGKIIVVLPGVPSEMKRMFEESVLGELSGFAGEPRIESRKLKCFGMGESDISELLGPVMARERNPQIGCTAEQGVITLTITAWADNKQKAWELAERDEKLLRDKLGDIIFATDEQSLAEVVGTELARQNKRVALGESCTGGLLAKLLTDLPGSSRYFTYGWITYSDKAKSTELLVPLELLERYGAVSEPVAEAMAKGAQAQAGADFAIGITGIAGPGGGTEQKPVGLVYISVASKDECETRRFAFCGERASVRYRTANSALNMLRMKLKV